MNRRRKEYSEMLNEMIKAGIEDMPKDQAEALEAIFDFTFECGKACGISAVRENIQQGMAMEEMKVFTVH